MALTKRAAKYLNLTIIIKKIFSQFSIFENNVIIERSCFDAERSGMVEQTTGYHYKTR